MRLGDIGALPGAPWVVVGVFIQSEVFFVATKCELGPSVAEHVLVVPREEGAGGIVCPLARPPYKRANFHSMEHLVHKHGKVPHLVLADIDEDHSVGAEQLLR